MMPKTYILPLALALLGGCSGEYLLVAPDVAGMPGNAAAVVVRLQRREFWFHAPAESNLPVTFDLAADAQRAGRTDADGYTGVQIAIPRTPGKYLVELNVQDTKGDTASGEALVYALTPNVPIVVVDLDALPRLGVAVDEAATSLVRIQKQGQIVYVTQGYAREPARAHDVLASGGYPDGPVLPWRKSSWWHRQRWWRGTNPAVTSMADLKARLPLLRWGVTSSASAGRTFAAAGVEPLLVTWISGVAGATVYNSWAELTLGGAPAATSVRPALPPAKQPWWKFGRAKKPTPPAAPTTRPAVTVVDPPGARGLDER